MVTADLSASGWQVLAAGMAAVAAIASAIAAAMSLRAERRSVRADVLFRVVERLERTRVQRGRVIYELDRENYAHWVEKDRELVHELIAELDLIALLVLARRLNVGELFAIYGDTILRVLYQLVPYISAAQETRGDQFALPLAKLTPLLVLGLGRLAVAATQWSWGFP